MAGRCGFRLINLLDVRPGGIDRTTLGHPGKFSYCLAEDEEDTDLAAAVGQSAAFPEGVSAVTVMAAMAPRQIMNEWTTDPREILETFAAEMRANQRHYSIYGGNYAIVIPKQLREPIQAAGWTKRDIAEFLYERARVRRGEWADVGKGAVVRDRGETDSHRARIAGSSPGRGCRRPGGRLRRSHSAVVREARPRPLPRPSAPVSTASRRRLKTSAWSGAAHMITSRVSIPPMR